MPSISNGWEFWSGNNNSMNENSGFNVFQVSNMLGKP